MRELTVGRGRRWVSLVVTLALALPGSLAVGIAAAPPAQAADPQIQLTKDGPAQVLVGSTATYTLTARNPSGADQVTQYNLSFRDVLPPGVVYVGPTTPASAGTPTIYLNRLVANDPATEYQTLVWSNVADLQLNSSAGISFTVRAEKDPLPVSSTFTNRADAYTNADPRYVPKFGPNGVVVPGPTSYTASATVTTGNTGVTAFTIDKASTPTPEGELLRGVHDHVATYSLTVTNNPSFATNQIVVRDYLPAGLEFLGCGTVDNSTNTTLYPNGREYPTAPSLSATALVADCLVPSSVETVEGPLVDEGRAIPAGVYTKVTWLLGDLTASGPGRVKTITYRAGVPQRANTTDWQGGPTPAVTGGGTVATQPPQTANLDNNTGPPTRETGGEQALTNVAVGSGLYTGPVPGQPGPTVPVSSSTQHTVTAEDLDLQKTVSPTTFDTTGPPTNGIATYTLTLHTSEYVTASGIVITDVMPNGVCPVWATATPVVAGPLPLPAECGTGGSPQGANPTGATLASVTRNADGTFTLVFAPVSAAADGTLTVTYQGRMRTVYTGGPLAGQPTSAGDTFTNSVSLTGSTAIRTDIDVNAPAPNGTEQVSDASSATQSSKQPVIDKRIKPNVSGALGYRCEAGTGTFVPGSAVTAAGAAEYVNPPAPPLTGADVDRFTFRNGSVACFLLRVEFPSQSQTKNPVVTDFLPAGTTYVPSSAVVTDRSTLTGGNVALGFDSGGNPVWNVGVPSGGSRFAPESAVFEVVLAVTIDSAAAGSTPDLVGNLMKFRSESSAGQAISLRDQLDLQIAPLPPVTLVKGISQITPAVPAGSPAQPVNVPPAAPTNQDGRTVRDGDVVQFRIDVTNTSNTLGPDYQSSVRTVDVWDLLPAGIPCSSVTNASSPVFFSCLDPSSGSYPASLAGTNRSLLRWQFDSSDTESIAPGARRTLTYDFTVPDDVSVATRLTDNAGVRSYQAFTNLPSVAATYYPVQNIDPGVPVADRDAPRADDPSNVVVANVALTKTGTTSITEDNNNTPDQATIGELVTYPVTATVPYGTSVYQGVLTDTLPDGLTYVSAAAEYSTDNGATWTTTLPNGTVPANNGQLVTLTLPPSYTAAANATANHVFRMTIVARVTKDASNAHGKVWPNTVTFLSKASAAPGAPNVTAPTPKSYSVTVVEPSPSLLKTASPDKDVVVGTPITYTLTASNAAGRPPMHDSWVVDCLPAGLEFLGYVPAGRSDVLPAVPGDGGNGCLTGQTRLAWNPTSPNPPAPAPALTPGTLLAGTASAATLQYTAQVSATSAGLTSYTNAATLTGGTLDDPEPTPPTPFPPANPDERTYTTPAGATVRVQGGTVTKSVTPTAATIGQTATWTITATLPAKVNFYRATIVDEVRLGIDIGSVATTSVTCQESGGAPCTVGSARLADAAGPGTATRIAWYLDDVAQSDTVRTVTIVYTAKVANIDPTTPKRGDGLLDIATLKWDSTNTTQPPTSAGATFQQSSDPAQATVTVQEPLVTIEKAVSIAAPAPGDVFTYTLTVRNSSATNVSTAYRVAVEDVVPPGVVVDPATISDGGTISPDPVPTTGGGTITWPAVPSLAPGGSAVRTYQARLAPSASLTAAGKLNTASVNGYNSLADGTGRPYAGPSASRTVTPVFPRVTVVKSTPDGDVAYVGEPLTWRFAITNGGPARAYGVDAVDTLPENWTYTATSSVLVAGVAQSPVPQPVLGVAAGGNQTLTWMNLGNLAPTQEIVVTFTATPQPAAVVDPGAGSTVAHTNTVSTTAEDATGAQGSQAGPYSGPPATAAARIDAADLVLDKFHPATPAPVAGRTFDWTIRVTNNGPDTAVGPFTVTDTVAAPTTFASAGGTGWSCSAAGAVVTCTRTNPFDTLASGASFEDITVRVAVPSDLPAGTTLTNTAGVTARTYDPVPGNNTDTDTATSAAEADLAIFKGRTGPLEAGRDVTYTLNVSNLGPSTSRRQIRVTDPVPSGTTYVSAAGAGWDCSLVTGTVTCTRDTDLLAGQAAPQITVVLAVSSAFTGTLTNTATVAGPTPDPVPGNNTATNTGTVTTLADVAIEKTHGGDFVPARRPTRTRSRSRTSARPTPPRRFR